MSFLDSYVIWDLAVAGTWRLTKDIFRFDPDLYQILIGTSLEGDISFDFLKRLPAWCIYVETQNLTVFTDVKSALVKGFWAMIEHDANYHTEELRLFFFLEDGSLLPAILQIDKTATISQAMQSIVRRDSDHNLVDPQILQASNEIAYIEMHECIEVALNLLLYICAYWESMSGGFDKKPGRPTQMKSKKGWRFFPAERGNNIMIGSSIGEKIRSARKSDRESQAEDLPSGREKTRRSPRPHVRRAHWHGYWTGPRNPGETQESRKFELKWIPPIPVALGKDEEADPA